jgi:hypothetical protein
MFPLTRDIVRIVPIYAVKDGIARSRGGCFK